MENKLIYVKFIDLLVAISSEEEKIEEMRINLCQNPFFTLYHGFSLFDQTNRGFITDEELYNFVEAEPQILKKVIQHYSDPDDDGISFPNFMFFILPHNNQKLRQDITSRQSYNQISQDEISIIKDQLAMLLEKEIKLFTLVEKYSAKYNFNSPDKLKQVFNEVDKNHDGQITQEDLVAYCFHYKYKLYKEQFQFVWNRLNTQNKAAISLHRFIQFFTSILCHFDRQTETKDQESYALQPLSNNWQTLTSCPYHPITKEQRDNIPDLEDYFHQRQVLKYGLFVIISNRKFEKRQIHLMLKVIQDQGYFNQQIEKMKQDLCSQCDFNLIDCFRIFDRFQKGIIGPIEIYDTLEKLLSTQFQLENHDISLFVAFFDKDKDQKIIFSDFAQTMIPQSEKYAYIIQNQQTYANGTDFDFILNTFSSDTQELIKVFFAKLLLLLKYINKSKIDLKKELVLRLIDLFAVFDVDQDQVLNESDIALGARRLKIKIKNPQLSYFFQGFGQDILSFDQLQRFFQPI